MIFCSYKRGRGLLIYDDFIFLLLCHNNAAAVMYLLYGEKTWVNTPVVTTFFDLHNNRIVDVYYHS